MPAQAHAVLLVLAGWGLAPTAAPVVVWVVWVCDPRRLYRVSTMVPAPCMLPLGVCPIGALQATPPCPLAVAVAHLAGALAATLALPRPSLGPQCWCVATG